MKQEASLVVRWKAEDGWPIMFMSKGISMFGYTPEDFSSGKVTWNNFTYQEDIPRLKKELAENIRLQNEEFDQEYRVVTKDGNIRWVLDKTVVIKEHDSANMLHSILVDITSIKQREESYIRYAENLEETRQSLSKANRILFLQSKVIDCLCGYSDSLAFTDILKLMGMELKVNSIFVYACNGKCVEQLSEWTKPNGHGEWTMPKTVPMNSQALMDLRQWIQTHDFSFEAVNCLPNELEFISCEASLCNITNLVIASIKIADKPWGVVCFGTQGEKMWKTEELKALSSLGKMTALVSQKYRNMEIMGKEIESRIGQIKDVIKQINEVEYARCS